MSAFLRVQFPAIPPFDSVGHPTHSTTWRVYINSVLVDEVPISTLQKDYPANDYGDYDVQISLVNEIGEGLKSPITRVSYVQPRGLPSQPGAPTVSLILFPSGGVPTVPGGGGGDPAQAITGWTNVDMTPLDATGSGTRYDVTDDTSFQAVPWSSLTAGSAVNIFHRATPYRFKVCLTTVGTSTNPIRIKGITNIAGQRPVIDAANAVTIDTSAWGTTLRPLALWTFARHRGTGTYGIIPQHWQILNLKFQGAATGVSYDGGSTYSDGSSGVRIQSGRRILISGCEFEDNGNGFFTSMGDSGEPTGEITIRGNRFEGNGVSGSFLEHGMYLQAISEPGEYNIIEGNFFGELRSGALGLCCKTRCTGTIIRYNWIHGDQRCIDIVQAQDGTQDWVPSNYTAQEKIDYFHTSYIYGNVLVSDMVAGFYANGTGALHYGLDGEETLSDASTATRVGPCYFYNNTYFVRVAASGEGTYRSILFSGDIAGGPGSGANSNPCTFEMRNNIINVEAISTRMSWGDETGTFNISGSNLARMTGSFPTLFESESFANVENTGDDPNIAINITGTLVSGNPLFVDAANADPKLRDYSLQSGSPAKGVAAALPAALAAFPCELQPVSPNLGGGAATRASNNDLGAFE